MSAEHLDVLIIGAGLSGIGAAYHLMKHCPGKRFAILDTEWPVVRRGLDFILEHGGARG